MIFFNLKLLRDASPKRTIRVTSYWLWENNLVRFLCTVFDEAKMMECMEFHLTYSFNFQILELINVKTLYKTENQIHSNELTELMIYQLIGGR